MDIPAEVVPRSEKITLFFKEEEMEKRSLWKFGTREVVYANRVLLVYGGELVADGTPFEVLKDESLLRHSRVLPTSLLRANVEAYPRLGRFHRAETLERFLS